MTTLMVAHSQLRHQASVETRYSGLFSGFNGSHVGGGIVVADGPVLLVDSGLSEHTTEFTLARAGSFGLDSARSAVSFSALRTALVEERLPPRGERVRGYCHSWPPGSRTGSAASSNVPLTSALRKTIASRSLDFPMPVGGRNARGS